MEVKLFFDYEERGPVILISPKHSIELYHVNQLRQDIETIFNTGKYQTAIFTMEQVVYMDSSGIGVFLQLRQIYLGRITMRFCNMNPNVKMVFEYTNLVSHFIIDPDLSTSLAAVEYDNRT
jgi:stage II sporulation protein AA (anti-sigma F factor antagonist)